MFPCSWALLCALACLIGPGAAAQEPHAHAAPERLGAVNFPVSCNAEVQEEFNRAVALLHSFAYDAAREGFASVTKRDPRCSMAHWGIAMTTFHQLWEPPIADGADADAKREIAQAQTLGVLSGRERGFVRAAGLLFENTETVPYRSRALLYEHAMAELASQNKKDVEAQTFYALALLANASPADKTHARQKQAAGLLEPLFQAYPQHPGIPHYLIHACDNAELASSGLPAAKSYSQIAPSAPHALHMPSHIFTRLGLWDDSVASNLAARKAAHDAGDTSEELHAMDYLVYAYLQSGRDAEAAEVIEQAKAMPDLNRRDFKIGYAATVMPIRYDMERGRWAEVAKVTAPPPPAPPHVVAIAIWAKGTGLARSGRPAAALATLADLQRIQDELQSAGNTYWAAQVSILSREVTAWAAQADGRPEEALQDLRAAADAEDSLEKLPVTPGPIIPAREQLGDLLLLQNQPQPALREFQAALADAPGRAGPIRGVAQASSQLQAH